MMSHPVALSQCRRWLAAASGDRGGAVLRHGGQREAVMARGLARYGGDRAGAGGARSTGRRCWSQGIEDHAENFTRFHLRGPGGAASAAPRLRAEELSRDKMSLWRLRVEHRPGTLVAALEGLCGGGVDLTKIESRPVPGRRGSTSSTWICGSASRAWRMRRWSALRGHCGMVKELGRYVAA